VTFGPASPAVPIHRGSKNRRRRREAHSSTPPSKRSAARSRRRRLRSAWCCLPPDAGGSRTGTSPKAVGRAGRSSRERCRWTTGAAAAPRPSLVAELRAFLERPRIRGDDRRRARDALALLDERRSDSVDPQPATRGLEVSASAAGRGPRSRSAPRLTSSLVGGSGIAFADRGTHALKGVPNRWQLFAVEDAPMGSVPGGEVAGKLID
jgi:hypothetical protein